MSETRTHRLMLLLKKKNAILGRSDNVAVLRNTQSTDKQSASSFFQAAAFLSREALTRQRSSQSSYSQSASKLPMFLSKHLTFLAYLIPSTSLWNVLHEDHANDGGLWNYNGNVQSSMDLVVESRHPDYESVWDVACNLGIMLERMSKAHPERKFVGSDISDVMVAATKARCPTCTAEVFDLTSLQSEDFQMKKGHLPEPVDVVVVADVLYYMQWGHWPPFMNRVLPWSWTQSSRETFWHNLKGLAKKEVIFSNHQNNPAVIQLLQHMGASYLPAENVWVTPGTADLRAATHQGL
eukprot:TRINITY_DN4784_c0_g3_i3.p1 TRINITY_DN4784_c0_g3~~TRINITY_DN4784_c0_g3_i3.p1  ORF type:complete len:295 (-),score=35.09 TRINITY_DN4784_c0_g3_i3:249-1133(-)